MAAVSAAGQTGEVPSFVDRLGERFVVAQPSGALLEFLVFHPGLSSAPFFEGEVKARLKRLSNFRHAAYARSTRLQRDPIRGNRLTLVAAYAPGRRLCDILVLARRGRLQPPIGAVLALAKQLMTTVALLHDYAPDVFHGAIGPERLVVGADGRLIVTEYVLGTAIEKAVPEFGVTQLWRECRLGTLADTKLARYGRRLDLLQIGLVTLSLLLGRQLSDGDFPARVRELLDAARETPDEGEAVPLGGPLREWLARVLQLDPDSCFKTLIEAQKGLARVLEEDETRYRLTPEAVQAFLARCEDLGTLSISAPADSGSIVAATTAMPPGDARSGSEASANEPAPPPTREPASETPTCEPSPVTSAAAVTADPVADASDASHRSVSAEPGSTTVDDAKTTRAPASLLPAGDRSATLPSSAADDAIAEMLAALPKPLETGSAVDPFEPFPNMPPAVEAAAPSEPPAPAVDTAAVTATTEARAPVPRAIGPAPSAAAVEVDQAWPASAMASAAPSLAVDSSSSAPQAITWSDPFVAEAAVSEADAGWLESGVELIPSIERSAAGQSATIPRASVLSYDEVHRAAAPRRSKAPFVWAAAALIVLAAGGLVGGPRIGALLKQAAKPAEAVRAPAASTEPGGFKITTQPAGSRITIDGTQRGTAPLQVSDLAPGLHSIAVESEWGRLEETVTVEAGKVVPLALATVGWIKVDAPVQLDVSEDGRTYGVTGQALMVPAGRHAFIFSNPSVAVRQRQFVQVPAGQTVRVALDLPKGMLNLTADQPAQVLVDGELIGDTPQLSVPAALGPHEVIFRNARYGDVSYSVNVTLAAPVTLTAAFGARR